MKKSKIIISALLSVFTLITVLSALLVFKSNAKQTQSDEFLFEETTDLENSVDFSLGNSSYKLLDYVDESGIRMGVQKSELVNGKQSIRLVAEITGLNVTPVWTRGFFNSDNVDCAPNENTLTSTKAYKTLNNIGTADENKYYVTYTLKDIPVSDYSSYTLAAYVKVGEIKSNVVLVPVDGVASSQENMPKPDGYDNYKYIYFYNTSWTEHYVYSWNDDNSNTYGITWPGKKMTKVIGKNYWYKAPVNDSVTHVIFNNSNGTQTNNITLVSGKTAYNYNDSSWYKWYNLNLSNNKVYLLPNSDWKQDGAKMYLYLFVDKGPAKWLEMSIDDDYYSYDVSQLKDIDFNNYEKMIFVRVNPDCDPEKIGFDAKWNQTDDLSLKTGNLYVINGWDNSGFWM